jgi:RluA family pseudouridine synthase
MKFSVNYEILYEDRYLVVVNKPHSLLVVEDRYDKSLVTLKQLLTDRYKKIFVVHKLDFGTAGIILFAKDDNTHKKLCHIFETGTVYKEYFAIVEGINFLPVTVMLPISKRNYHGKYKINFTSGRSAITSFIPIEEKFNKTLLRCILYTGRTHQIRVHLKAIKYPLYNDFLYNKKTEDKRLTLMCNRISFVHPETGEIMDFTIEMSEYMKGILNTY